MACSNAAASDRLGDGDFQTKLWPKHKEAANTKPASNGSVLMQQGNTHLACSL